MATLADLRTRARTLADQELADFPTDAQYNLWLNEARRETWYDLMAAGYPVNYTNQTIPMTGAAQYAIASGAAVVSVRSVYFVQGGTYTLLPRLDETQKAGILSQSTPLPAAYEVLVDPDSGTVVRLYPESATGSMRVEYIAAPADMDDNNVWYGPDRSDMLLCLQAAAKGCRKEGRRGDAADLLSDYATLLEKVQASASWVDQRNVARIRDVNQAFRRDAFDYEV